MKNLTVKSSLSYRPDIDGLRALAVISVIIFHFYSFILPSGFVGVDIFFVISGFLITKIILKEHAEKQFSFAKFYIRRIRRIFPALFTMLFVSYIAAFLTLTSSDMIWFSRGLYYASLQISNFFFQRGVDYFDENRDVEPILHTWSLGVEEQFYLLMPLIIWAIFRFNKNKNFAFYILIFLSAVSLAASQYLVFVNQKIAFYSLLSRFWELGVGCLIAFNSRNYSLKISNKNNNILALIGLVMIIISLFVIKYSNFPGLLALLPCVGAALIIFSGEETKTLTAKFLSNRVFVFIGKISYSLYLWHLPLVIFYKEYANKTTLTLEESLILLSILLVISFLSWRFIEMPFRAKYISPETNKGFNQKIILFFKKPFFIAAVCIISIATIASITQKTHGLSSRLTHNDFVDRADIDVYASFEKASLCGIGKKSHQFPNIDQCVVGKNQETYEVAIFGDSHAGHYSSNIINLAEKRGLSTLSFYLFSCPILITEIQDTKENSRCIEYRQKIWQILKDKKHIKYVFLASSWDGSISLDKESMELFRKNITETIEKITSLNKKVIILGRIPAFDGKVSPLKCVEKNLVPMQKIIPLLNKDCIDRDLTSFSKQQEFAKIIKEAVATNKNALFFDPFPYFCDKKECHAGKDGVLFYSDQGHLNKWGAEYLKQQNLFSFVN